MSKYRDILQWENTHTHACTHVHICMHMHTHTHARNTYLQARPFVIDHPFLQGGPEGDTSGEAGVGDWPWLPPIRVGSVVPSGRVQSGASPHRRTVGVFLPQFFCI